MAAVTAPGFGSSGQNMDIALIFADGKAGGKADPAYDAHTMPIGQWAMAVWEHLGERKVAQQNDQLREAELGWGKEQVGRRTRPRCHFTSNLCEDWMGR